MKKSLLITALTALAFSPLALNAAPEIGKPAPGFTLKDTAGKEHSLSDFEGKVVVLEWINHGCPFVVKHYGSGNMQKLQEQYTGKDVVWLSVCSSAPGTQGHMNATDAAAKSEKIGSKATAYLLDEDGTVGKAYGAKRTPEMFVIDKEGTLVYMGAIDDKPSADQSDIEGSTNFVSVALDQVLGGEAVANAQTTAYGCSVKYAD